MQSLRWGIIGCGLVAGDLILSLRQCQHDHRVVCTADADLSKAVGFLEEFGIKNGKAYSDYSELLQNPDVDIVFIDLTNDAHVTWALKAIEAEKHIIVEKPLAVNKKQVRLIVEKARLSNKFLMESFWSRFFPSWRKIKEIVNNQELGKLLVFHCNLGSGRSTTRDLTKGKCPIMSIGTYPICLALYVFGDIIKPQKIDVVGGVEDRWANITLQFSENQHAFVYYNSEAYSPTNAYLSFEYGQIQIPNFFWAPESFKLINGPIKNGIIREFQYPLNDQTRYNFSNGSGLRYQSDHIFEMIRDGHTSSNVMSLESSMLLAEILEEVRRKLGISFPQD